MKKILLSLFCLSGSILILLSSCSKEEGAIQPGDDGPDVVLRTEGTLCTMGINYNGNIDTLAFVFSTSGMEMSGYGYGYSRDIDQVHITQNGNNTVSLIKNIPYVYNSKDYKYFGIQKNTNPSASSFPNNDYLYYFFYESPSVETQFVMERSKANINKFTIESNSHPGYFLGTAKWKNAVYPTESRLVFTGKKQEFFFMAK